MPQPDGPAVRRLRQYLRPHACHTVERRCLRRVQQRQQHPLPRRVRIGHRLRRHRYTGHGRQIPQLLLHPLAAVDEDELLLGPGHGHVEDAHLLGLGLPFQPQRQRLLGDGGVADVSFPIHPIRAKPQLRMHQHRPVQVLPVEAALEIRQDHHGELQSLGPVDAHDLHALRRPGRPQRRRVAVFQQLPQMTDEVE